MAKISQKLLRMQELKERNFINSLNGSDVIADPCNTIQLDKVSDKVNMFYTISYSDCGNIIGELTNTNSLLSNFLNAYETVEEKVQASLKVFKDFGKNPIKGKRYSIDGKSALLSGVNVLTNQGFETNCITVNSNKADKFLEILSQLDINCLTTEDFDLIEKDMDSIARTQEFAIDVAKDKTIKLVDTRTWLRDGTKEALKGFDTFDNIKLITDENGEYDIVQKEEKVAEFFINTKFSNIRQVMIDTTKEFFNTEFKALLETATLKTDPYMDAYNNYPYITHQIKAALGTFISFKIENSFLDYLEYKKAIKNFAEITRNTIYNIFLSYKINNPVIISKTTAAICRKFFTDNLFREVMPFEFLKLNGVTANYHIVEEVTPFYVDNEWLENNIGKDDITLVNGEYIEDGVIRIKVSRKYNECVVSILDNKKIGIQEKLLAPAITNEIIVPFSPIEDNTEDVLNEEYDITNKELLFYPTDNSIAEELSSTDIELGKFQQRDYALNPGLALTLINKSISLDEKAINNAEAFVFLKSQDKVKIMVTKVIELGKEEYRHKYAIVKAL